MSRISYEQRVLAQEIKDKKITSRNARHTRTHCGKSGGVKFPSDYMTKKEIKAMNGECKSYRMNEPMIWDEFKVLPDDLKVVYVKALRQKYNVPDSALAAMFGVSGPVVSRYFKEIGLVSGKGASSSRRSWDKDGFDIWRGKVIETDAVLTREDVEAITVKSDIPEPDYTYNTLVPNTGEMTFEGEIDDILRTVGTLLNGAKVHLSVKWDVIKNHDEVDPETQKSNLKKATAAATYALMNAERREKLGTKG